MYVFQLSSNMYKIQIDGSSVVRFQKLLEYENKLAQNRVVSGQVKLDQF